MACGSASVAVVKPERATAIAALFIVNTRLIFVNSVFAKVIPGRLGRYGEMFPVVFQLYLEVEKIANEGETRWETTSLLSWFTFRG